MLWSYYYKKEKNCFVFCNKWNFTKQEKRKLVHSKFLNLYTYYACINHLFAEREVTMVRFLCINPRDKILCTISCMQLLF